MDQHFTSGLSLVGRPGDFDSTVGQDCKSALFLSKSTAPIANRRAGFSNLPHND